MGSQETLLDVIGPLAVTTSHLSGMQGSGCDFAQISVIISNLCIPEISTAECSQYNVQSRTRSGAAFIVLRVM